MPGPRLSELVAADIAEHRRQLLELGLRAEGGLLTAQDEVTVSKILVGCKLILDRVMNAVWVAHHTQRPGKGKANVYFPCRSSPEGFDQELTKSQLCQLEAVNAAAYQAIRSRQPFAGIQNDWLRELFDLNQDRHENYVEIASSRNGEMHIGEGQSGHLRSLVITNDGRVFADADMVDGKTGKPAPLRLTFVARFNHMLRSTGRDPVTYCRECIDHVEDVFFSIVRTLV